MKRYNFIFSFFLLILLPLSWSQAGVSGENFEFSGYMRAGSGLNLKGGAQECFNLEGAGANQFRLGNECHHYGDFGFTAYHFKGKEPNSPYFKSQLRFAFNRPGYSSFENEDSDGNSIAFVEAFAEGGNLSEIPIKFWAGKRFYRVGDTHLFDWYDFQTMNGNGAGFFDLDIHLGRLSIAHLIEIRDAWDKNKEKDRPAGQILDVRLDDVLLTSQQKLHFWFALGQISGGTKVSYTTNSNNEESVSGRTEHSDSTGWLASLRHQTDLSGGFNFVTLSYAQGWLYNFGPWSDPEVKGEDTLAKKNTIRLVNHFTGRLSQNIESHFVLSHQIYSSPKENETQKWTAIGIRPVYFFTKHFNVAFEAGYAQVESEISDLKTLSRFTIAPQLSASDSIWGRPVLRAYLTTSLWNKANQNYIANSAPSFANETQGWAFGWQTEFWF